MKGCSLQRDNKCLREFFGLSVVFLIASCGQDAQTKQFAQKQAHLSDNIIKAHKQFVTEESLEIDSFIKARGYNMEKSPTGLRYNIESNSNGEKVQPGDVVALSYAMYLLDGTLCYSSDNGGSMIFKASHADIPNGINEAVLMMRPQDSARLVIPAHLAYGLSGDEKNIPPESALYCTVKVINVKKEKQNGDKKSHPIKKTK